MPFPIYRPRFQSSSMVNTLSLDSFIQDKLLAPKTLLPALPELPVEPAVVVLLPGQVTGLETSVLQSGVTAAARLAALTSRRLRLVAGSVPQNAAACIATWLPPANHRLPEANISVSTAETYLPLSDSNIYIAIEWRGAYQLQQLPLSQPFVYVLPDDEALLAGAGDQAAWIAAGYGAPNSVMLCQTEQLYAALSWRYPRIAEGSWFEPGTAKPDPSSKRAKTGKRRLLLQADPSVPASLFTTGLRSLAEAGKSGPLAGGDWTVFVTPESGAPNIQLAPGLVAWPIAAADIDYRDFDVVLAPHYSPAPGAAVLQAAGGGAAVVSTRFEAKTDLSSYSKNIILAEPNEIALAEALAVAIAMPNALRQRNLKRSKLAADWSSLDKALAALIKNHFN